MKTELKEKMMDVALEHIYKVNADPDIELEDVDAYDAWIRFDKDWDLNVHEANFGMIEKPSRVWRLHEDDSSKFEWYCSAYPVEIDGDGFEYVNTANGEHIFKYKKEGKVTFITDQ